MRFKAFAHGEVVGMLPPACLGGFLRFGFDDQVGQGGLQGVDLLLGQMAVVRDPQPLQVHAGVQGCEIGNVVVAQVQVKELGRWPSTCFSKM